MVTEKVPSWTELMNQRRRMSEIEKVAVNCIATISSHPNYAKMTPAEIYAQMVETRLTFGKSKGGS